MNISASTQESPIDFGKKISTDQRKFQEIYLKVNKPTLSVLFTLDIFLYLKLFQQVPYLLANNVGFTTQKPTFRR